MGKKILLVCFCLFGFFLSLQAQKEITITGTITDQKGNPVPYIDVLLTLNDTVSQVVAFAVTNDAGGYRINYQTELNELVLETSSLSHQKYKKLLLVNKNTVKFHEDIQLKDRTELLNEVEIKAAAPKVRIKNDTTVFNLEKLTDGSERIAEDILKKLPGVSIEDNGKIKFKGKDVKNVLLDGDNLFDGRYTVGTKNINAKHIVGVEAVENFEDNPILQGLTQNEKVALNLKFDDGLSLSGKATAGYGYKDRYYLNGTAIAITKKLKGFSFLTYNNMGSRRGANHFSGMDYIQESKGGINARELDAPGYIGNSNELLQAGNSIKNSEFFGSLNILPRLSKTEVLRINIDALSDKAIEESSSNTIINIDPDNPIVIQQSGRKQAKPLYFNARAMFTSHLSKKSSIFTQMKFSRIKNDNRQSGIRNGLEQGENLLLKEHFLSNFTQYTHRINQTSALKIEGAAAISEKPENLELISGIDFNTDTFSPNAVNTQSVNSKKQSIKLQSNYYTKSRKGHKLNLNLAANYFKNSLQSSTTNIDALETYKNNVDYAVFLPKFSIDYFLDFDKIEIHPILTGKIYDYKYDDNNLKNTKENANFLWDAAVRINYKLGNKHTISGNFMHTNTPPDEKNLYTDFILRTNRVLQNNELNFSRLKKDEFGFSYSYSNLFRDIRAGVGFIYKKANSAYLSSNQINQDVMRITHFLLDKGKEDRIYNLSLHKYVSAVRSSFNLMGSYTSSNYFNLVNSDNFRKNTSETTNVTFGISTSFIWKFLFANQLIYNKTKFNIQESTGFKNENITNNFEISFIPNDRFVIDANLNYNIPDIHKSENRTFTLDASIGYENKKKTITYRLEGKNLLDDQNKSRIFNTDYSTTSSTNSLFERYFLLTVGFRF
jgi:hypothetical protein